MRHPHLELPRRHGSQQRAQRLCLAGLILAAAKGRCQRRQDRVLPEGQIGGVLAPAPGAGLNGARLELPCVEPLADTPGLRTPLLAEVALRAALRQIELGWVTHARVGLRVPEHDHTRARAQQACLVRFTLRLGAGCLKKQAPHTQFAQFAQLSQLTQCSDCAPCTQAFASIHALLLARRALLEWIGVKWIGSLSTMMP